MDDAEIAEAVATTTVVREARKRPRSSGQSDRAARTAELTRELRRLKLTRRSDSTLCDAFVAGRTSKTAAQVAEVMARMRYLHEFCPAFDERVEEVENDVEEMVDQLAEQNAADSYDRDRVYYSGINADAVREVYGNGFYSIGDVKRDIADSWSDWPETWPWLEDDDDDDDDEPARGENDDGDGDAEGGQDLHALKKDEVKRRCRDRGLKVSGNKPDLIARLQQST